MEAISEEDYLSAMTLNRGHSKEILTGSPVVEMLQDRQEKNENPLYVMRLANWSVVPSLVTSKKSEGASSG